MSQNTAGYALGWDDEIENEGPEFVVLPEGDYDFEVISFERARHAGSANLPACPKAIVSIKIKGEKGTTTIKHNLFLHSNTEGFLCAFFTAIGQRKKGEKITMNWNQVVGSKGRAKVYIDKWKNDKGEELTSNKIQKFYEPEESESKEFEPGRF